jgi:hypothetical protein
VDNWDEGFCKWSEDAHGKRFAVHIRFWKHSKFGPDFPDGWDAWMRIHVDGKTVDLTLRVNKMTSHEVFVWMENAWVVLKGEYYERWGE